MLKVLSICFNIYAGPSWEPTLLLCNFICFNIFMWVQVLIFIFMCSKFCPYVFKHLYVGPSWEPTLFHCKFFYMLQYLYVGPSWEPALPLCNFFFSCLVLLLCFELLYSCCLVYYLVYCSTW